MDKKAGTAGVCRDTAEGNTGIPGEILIEKGELEIRLPLDMGTQELCAVVERMGGLV
jgi:hypothetical protein